MRVSIDRFIVDSLMPDLVGHDKQPSAFIVFLYLWSRATMRGGPQGTRGRRFVASLQQIAFDTGLSKSAVQHAIRTLKRRRLIQADRASATTAPDYLVHAPWRR